MNCEQFIALVSTEQESLRLFLLALCVGNRDDADDIAQEALIKAYLARDKIRNDEKLGAWLYRIAYNTFLDHQRSLRTHAEIEEADTLVSETATDAGFEYQNSTMRCEPFPQRSEQPSCCFTSRDMMYVRLPTSCTAPRLPCASSSLADANNLKTK